jgi:hypothetical protein
MLNLLEELVRLDFNGRSEAYVESYFLTPLLRCLGYEQHKDYEVLTHGDDGSSFKLAYPPVEKGAKLVKHYNPDYIPTIRKKAFWIIEAKSPKDNTYPFEYKYIVQGSQYCIHPEIQANFLVISNGIDTCVYDPYSATYLDGSFYEPVLHFKHFDLIAEWKNIFSLLSNENVRKRVEEKLVLHFEKLASSSFDKHYPEELYYKIGKNRHKISMEIEKYCIHLKVKNMDENRKYYLDHLYSLTTDELYKYFDFPLGPREGEASIYIKKRINEVAPGQIFYELTSDFEIQSIFHKENTFLALALLSYKANHKEKEEILKWLLDRKDGILNQLNLTETTLLRLTRKQFIIGLYPKLRTEIKKELENAPEIIKFVETPSTLDATLPIEILIHEKQFRQLKTMNDSSLAKLNNDLLAIENNIETQFQKAYKDLSSSESQIGGYEWYGYGGKHYAFRNILLNSGILKMNEIDNNKDV